MTSVCLIHITGMTCASCVSHVEKGLKRIKGVYGVMIGLMIERADIKYDPKVANTNQFIECITSLGYTAEMMEESKTGVDVLNLNVIFFSL